MFNLHSAFAIQLLTLVAAAALLAWTGHAQVHAKKLVRVIAYAAGVLSILSILCTAYYGVKYSRAGYFQPHMGMHGMMRKGARGMEGMMGGQMKNGMMPGMESNGGTAGESATTPDSQDHNP